MRTAFFRALMVAAERDPRINLVVGDIGFGVVEPFAEKYPKRFLNVGVAEQNLTGIAAGMALSGKIVFTYSIANFPTLRCLEQIRNDVCYHKADVKIVAVGGGYAYGALGATHHATEDLAIMRALPGMTVVAPADPQEAEKATLAVAQHPGPCYLRVGRAGEPKVHQHEIDFEIGRAIQVRDGEHLTFMSTGGMLQTAVQAAEILSQQGFTVRVLSMHSLKPFDSQAVLSAARETGAILTIEEHSITGGLGSAVAETLADASETRIPFRRIGVPAEFAPLMGSQEFLRDRAGLSLSGVLQASTSILATVKR
jgi:transketolase